MMLSRTSATDEIAALQSANTQLQARVEELEAALDAARVGHAGSECLQIYYRRKFDEDEACDCGADQHNAAIDAARGEG